MTIFESREERVADNREVDPKWMQENNMVGGSGGITSFTGLIEGGEVDKMRDPNAIMENVQNSIGGYAALHAIEGDEEAKGGFGGGTVAKVSSGAATSKTAYDLFHTPHSFGQPPSKIMSAARGGARKAVAYKGR